MEQLQTQHMRQELSQFLQMEQASLLELSESEFHRLITEVEKSSIFRKLYEQEKLIRYQRFPRTALSLDFYEFKEEISADRSPADVESLLLGREHLISLLQKLGIDKFKRYFLFPESGMTSEEIASECNLNINETSKINELINELSVVSEFEHPSTISSSRIRYSKIAFIQRAKEGFIITYFSPASARGRYAIDYEGFEELRTSRALTETEVREVMHLFRKLELINSRKDTMTKILQSIIDRQSLYLKSGDIKSLLPFSQKELAKVIGLAPSSICRAIQYKSIETSWREEIPLKAFFPKPKEFRKRAIKQLIETDYELSSDEIIRSRLWEKYGVSISRRSVANLRKELKLPAVSKRRTG